MSIEILPLDGPMYDAAIPDLALILRDAVAAGASVGFIPPSTPEDAAEWSRSLERDVVAGQVIYAELSTGELHATTLSGAGAPVSERERACRWLGR